MIKLSFIVPIYQVEKYLRKCVDSLLNQDVSPSEYEIVLVDDGGKDACPQICEEYAATYPNIRVIHRENGGLSAARNSGIAVAQGEYICFVDSDDYWQPNVLGGLMAQIERDNLDVLRFHLQYVKIVESQESKVKSERRYENYSPYKSDSFVGNDYSAEPTDGITFLNQRMNTQCYAWTFIIKRSLIERVSPLSTFDSPLSPVLFTPGIYFEDTDWTPRMLARAERVASTPTVVYNYLLKRQGSITNAPNREKLRKELDDKMRLVGEMRRQAALARAESHEDTWFGRMTASLVVSIIGLLSTDFYAERKTYLERLRNLQIYPLQSQTSKAKLINFSPRLAVELLHLKNGKLKLIRRAFA